MPKKLSPNDFMSHTDLSLCATLCCFGYSVDAVERVSPSKVAFLIKRDEKLDSLVEKYWKHELQVDPALFFSYLKELKSRINSN
ncbi:MAG: hypothetical protein HQ530_05655 [Parcubacteria group bacterium]|nr:hypothetical protein [Parcubacteria group bacterium]